MTKNWQIPRRTFLKGLGTAIALPMLESMIPARAMASTAGAPKRLAFVYHPNGVNMEDWTPRAAGPNFDMPFILQPLKPFQKDLQVISGLAHEKAKANGDGAGDHARANATFLTGVQAFKTAGADIRLGISVDQIAAQAIGRETRLPSLELSCEKARMAGKCDSGYSCAYQYNLSWKSATTPMAPEADPRLVFERLFGNGKKTEMDESRARRESYNKSILDFVLEDAKQLKSNLGTTDQRKLDEYLTAVREMEIQIEQAEKFANRVIVPNYQKPSGIPKDFGQHLRLMYDLLALAFQTDSTRIATYLASHDGSNRGYPSLGISEGHHDLSHHQNDEAKKKKIAKIDQFYTANFAYFIQKLKSVKEGDGTLLDNCLIVYGSGISDGNRHRHEDLPVILAGGGSGTLRPGRHVVVQKTPMTNLYVSLLNRMGVRAQSIGDSNGRFEVI